MHVNRLGQLSLVVNALRHPCRLARSLDRRHDNRNQHADNDQHNEHFDERMAAASVEY